MLYFKAFIEIYIMFKIFDLFSYWIMIVHFYIISTKKQPGRWFF